MMELLLYLSIAIVLLTSIASFLPTIIESRIKNQVIAQIEQEGLYITNLITHTIRNASTISSPAAGFTSGELSLAMPDANADPTNFSTSLGAFQISENLSSPIEITSSKTEVSNVEFHNISRTDTPGTIRFKFTLTHKNENNKNEYDYSKTFQTSASLRHP